MFSWADEAFCLPRFTYTTEIKLAIAIKARIMAIISGAFDPVDFTLGFSKGVSVGPVDGSGVTLNVVAGVGVDVITGVGVCVVEG